MLSNTYAPISTTYRTKVDVLNYYLGLIEESTDKAFNSDNGLKAEYLDMAEFTKHSLLLKKIYEKLK